MQLYTDYPCFLIIYHFKVSVAPIRDLDDYPIVNFRKWPILITDPMFMFTKISHIFGKNGVFNTLFWSNL